MYIIIIYILCIDAYHIMSGGEYKVTTYDKNQHRIPGIFYGNPMDLNCFWS